MSQNLLSKKEIEAVRKPLNQASLLPTRCYNDPEFYSREIENMFMRSWLPVGRVEQVPNPGDYFTKIILNEPVLIVRDKEGVLHALSNVCRHRSRIVAIGEGNCKGDKFTCQYHGWRYNLDGKLDRATYMEKAEGFNPDEIRLPKINMEIWKGFIFINFDPNAEPLENQVKGLEPVADAYDLENLKITDVLYRQSADWNWKVTMENFAEAMHHGKVHGESLEPMFPTTQCWYEDADGPYSLFWMPTKDGSDIPEHFPYIPGIPDDYKKALGTFNIFPIFHVLSAPDGILLLNFEFVDVEHHELSWQLLLPESTFEMDNFDELCKQYVDTFLIPVVNEDLPASRETALGLRSRFSQPGRISWMEKVVNQFHNYILDSVVG